MIFISTIINSLPPGSRDLVEFSFFLAVGVLVLLEVFLRATNGDDDDNDQGGGIMQPVYGAV